MAGRKNIDWEAIEREYRAGQLSIREIARQYDVSPALIVRKAKQQGWERDLTEQIRKSVNTKLVNTTVNTSVNTHVNTANTREVVEAAARRGVEVVRSHRKYLSRLLEVANRCLGDLEKDCDEEKPELKMSIREKADLLKATSQAIAKAIPLERQAFNLDESKSTPATGLETRRDAIRKQLESVPELKVRIQDAVYDC